MKTTPNRRRIAPVPVDSGVRVAWSESLRFCGPYPTVYKRFYKLETLKNAVEKALREKDRFLFASIQRHLVCGPPGVVKCDFVYEDALRLVFTLVASNKARKQVALRLVVAKNHEECSAQILAEYEVLTALHQRAPECVVEPCGHGMLYLPDRHHRREVNREVFGYFTKDAPGLSPLYVASNTQLAPHAPKPMRYSKKESEALKLALIRLVVRLYDEATATGVDPAGLYPECLAVPERAQEDGRMLLLQCKQVRKRLYRHKLIHNLLFSVLKTGATVLPLAPARPDDFYDVLCALLPKDTARAWCQAFLAKASTMNAHEHEELLPGREYLAALGELARQE